METTGSSNLAESPFQDSTQYQEFLSVGSRHCKDTIGTHYRSDDAEGHEHEKLAPVKVLSPFRESISSAVTATPRSSWPYALSRQLLSVAVCFLAEPIGIFGPSWQREDSSMKKRL